MTHLNGIKRSLLATLVFPFVLSGCLTDSVEPSAFVAEGSPQTINGAPVISGNPPQAIKIGVTYSFTPTASDPEGDALVFSVANMPIWAEFDQATGRLSGIPFLGSEGSYSEIEISVSDGVTSTALPQFTVTVEPVNAANMPPEIDGTPAGSVTIGNTYSFAPAASDPDGDLLSFTAQNVPSWATFNTTNGSLSGSPQAGDEGAYPNVAISVSDNISTASLPSFSIQVIGLNASPAISGTPDSQITVGQNYSFVPVATDPDGDALTFSVQNMPAWAAFDTQTGALTGIPQAGDAGTFAGIVIDVTDGVQTTALPAFTIDVNMTNSPPNISGTPGTQAVVGQNYNFTPTASDPDGDAITFSVQNAPVWLSIDSVTGTLSGVPQAGDVGSTPGIIITVADATAASSLPAFTISVAPTNTPPVISGTPGSQATVGSRYSFTPTATDSDGDTLTFSVQNRPLWLALNSSTGELTGTPQTGDVGTYRQIILTVSDGPSSASLVEFAIDVSGTNSAPQISGTPTVQITAGQNYSFVPVATDPDGDALAFSVQNMPAWATFDTQTGALSGIPQAGDVGTFPAIIIDVTDGTQTVALPPFSIDVNAMNSPPNISGTPGTQAAVGQSYTFAPTASDPDGDVISFSVQNAPAWLSIDSVTGTLSGIPQAGDVGNAPGIIITVADATAASSLPAFTISVAPTNTPPVISGTPGNQATVGSRYSFTPTATDSDGDTLTFSVQNRPLWLALNSSTGELMGTPQSGDVGNHGQVMLSVSDGVASASLAAFDIDVTAANSAPQISGTPATQVAAGDSYSFTPTATDADGDTLVFSIQNAPAWASFDENTGMLSGNTSAGNAGTYSNIQISVSDGELTTSLASFDIQVNSVSLGSATLTWTPPTMNTDGSPLNDLDGYVIYYGTAANAMNTPVPVNNPGLSSFVVDNLPPATYYFSISSVNSQGVESSLSNTAMKTINQ